MLGTPASTSAMNRTGVGEPRARVVLREVNAGEHPDRNADDARQRDQDRRADERISHSAGVPCMPGGMGTLVKKSRLSD